MRIHVDLDSCQGHGLCRFEAEQLFELRDSDGKAVVVVDDDDEVQEYQHDAARRAMNACPERAITIHD